MAYNHTMATIIALVIALLAFLGWVPLASLENQAPYLGALLFGFFLLLSGIGLIALKGSVKMTSSRVLSLFRQDLWQIGSAIYLSFFFLFSVLIDVSHVLMGLPFILGLGLAVDALLLRLRRMMGYFDPSFIIECFVSSPPSQWDIYDQLRPLYEIGYKAITRQNVSLCEEVLQGIEQAARRHLTRMEKEKADVGELDYFLGDLFQHLSPIAQEGLAYGYEPVVNKIIVFAGKIAIHVSQLHIEEASVPLHYLGSYAELAIEKKMRDVGAHATVTLQTVAKMVAQDPHVRQRPIKELFYTVIHHLHTIAKALFMQDKNTSLVLLCDPFHALKSLFREERLSGHPDQDAIIGQIDAVLAEFDALEKVMQAIPPINP